jgi:hypothetical protein
MFLLGYCHDAIQGGEPERALKAARALIANLPPDHATYEGLGLIGLFRCMGISALGESYEERSHEDRALRALAASAAKGEIDMAAICRRILKLTERANQESARSDGAFVHAFLASVSEAQRSNLQYWALDRARESLRRDTTLSPDRKSRIDAALSQAETELAAQREAGAKKRAEEWRRMFDAWLARARTPADLRTLEVISQRFAARAMLVQDPAEAVRLQGAISLLTAKIRLKSLRRWDQAARSAGPPPHREAVSESPSAPDHNAAKRRVDPSGPRRPGLPRRPWGGPCILPRVPGAALPAPPAGARCRPRYGSRPAWAGGRQAATG